MQTFSLAPPLVLATLLAGCIRDAHSPFVGDCASYPDGVYEFGEIGIGRCIAAPADLAFLEGEDGRDYLAVSNANAFRDFDSGSVLFLDWEEIVQAARAGDGWRTLTSDLTSHAVTLPDFAGSLAHVTQRDLLAVPVRYSPDATTRVYDDQVWFLDVARPLEAALAPVGEDGSSWFQVESDPFPAAYDERSGHLFVGNRTSHTVTVIQALADPMLEVDTSSGAALTPGIFEDLSGAGGTASFAVLEVLDQDALANEGWTLRWVDGTYRLWLPREDGLWRHDSGGDGRWWESGLGGLMDPLQADTHQEIVDPSLPAGSASWMVFSDDGDILAASPDEHLGDWTVSPDPLLQGRGGAWDQDLAGPHLVESGGWFWLFYDGTGDGGTSIGVARSTSMEAGWERVEDLFTMEPGGRHDQAGQADPTVLWDPQAEVWRMWYSGWDGDFWTVAEASSPDLLTWEALSEPALVVQDGDGAAPEVTWSNGRFRMWYSRREAVDGRWLPGYAESVDGVHWDDRGVALDFEIYEGASADPTPGVGLFAQAEGVFSVEAEGLGPLPLQLSPGVTFETSSHGWTARVAAGQLQYLDAAGDLGVNGLGVSAAVEEDLLLVDMVDAAGTPRVGLATWDGLDLVPSASAILEPGTGFDRDGISHPVVFQAGGEHVMLYAGHRGGVTTVGRAVSSDGAGWSKDGGGAVFGPGEGWESLSVLPGSVEVLEGGAVRLWYAGTDGDTWRVGVATSQDDGRTFQRADGPVFDLGSRGSWDSQGVSEPWVLRDGGTLHMWYAGFDGTTWNVGHATSSSDGETWSRDAALDGSPIPRLVASEGTFDNGGVSRPVLIPAGDSIQVFYRGWDGEVFRPGEATALAWDAIYKILRLPGAGDELGFSSRAGQDGVNPLDMDMSVDGFSVTGTGLSALYLDDEAGFLYAASKLTPYLLVFDVRDDSTGDFEDLNYLGLEAVLTVDTASGGTGFRSMGRIEGSPYLFALNDSPEAVMLFDTTMVEDEHRARVVRDALVGWLPTPVGGERDVGVNTMVSAGPTGLDFLPEHQLLFVTNFNDNSLGVYDLRRGAYGQLLGTVPNLGENPHMVKVSPDGRHAVVALYQGDVGGDPTRVSSTLAVVDVDPDSDTWLEVLTWIVNQ